MNKHGLHELGGRVGEAMATAAACVAVVAAVGAITLLRQRNRPAEHVFDERDLAARRASRDPRQPE